MPDKPPRSRVAKKSVAKAPAKKPAKKADLYPQVPVYGTTYSSKNLPPAPPPCHHTHPEYEVEPGFFIRGGSGVTPYNPEDRHILVSLTTSRVPGWRAWPWMRGVEDFVFPIENYKAPTDVENFEKMIRWLAERLLVGKKIHVGCYAGHGRTGIVFAALRSLMTNDQNAIEHVRKHYCVKAVETQEQIDFLVKYYNVLPAPARYKHTKSPPRSSSTLFDKSWLDNSLDDEDK